MKPDRTAVSPTPRAAWASWATTLVSGAALVALTSFTATQPNADLLLKELGVDDARIVILSFTIIALAAVGGATLGLLVVRERPANPVGWLLLVAALLGVGLWALDHYALLGSVIVPGSVPGVEWAALALVPVGNAWFVSILLAMWLFPTGGLWSRRWWRTLGVMLAVYAAATVVLMAIPGPLHHGQVEGQAPLNNPIGIPQLDALSGRGGTIDELVGPLAVLLTVAGLVARFRQARGEERAQLKWFVYAGAGLILAIVLASLAGPLTLAAYAIAPLALPLAMAVAIFRYRVYDIDRIISRTLAYAIITAVLAGAYLGLVFLLGAALRPLTAGSDLTVAASVLVVVALFAPVRRRVQSVVDRRFNRSRYDAEQTITTFSERLRQQVDLETLTDELAEVVHETMLPARLSIWLMDTGRDARRIGDEGERE